MEWMLLPLKRYADFQGRSRRMEYWMYTLGLFLFVVVLEVLLFGIVGAGRGSADAGSGLLGGLVGIVLGVVGLALIVPSLAVQVRRFHDQDKSGWLILLGLIPFVGGIIVLVFMCLDGTRGPNRFGADPLDPDGVHVPLEPRPRVPASVAPRRPDLP